MKIKRMNWFMKLITCGRAFAITLSPFGIYINADPNDYPYVINEEKTHWMQQIELMFVGTLLMMITMTVFLMVDVKAWMYLLLIPMPFLFYIWYLIEWIIKWLTPPVGAYKDLCFERESKDHVLDFEYYLTRKHFAQIKYLL